MRMKPLPRAFAGTAHEADAISRGMARLCPHASLLAMLLALSLVACGGKGDADAGSSGGDASLDAAPDATPDEGFDMPPELRECEGSFVVDTVDALEALAGCTRIGGDLTIQNLPLVESLTPLRFLERVDGTLTLRDDVALTDLRGLGALDAIGGDLDLEDADALESLAGLESLASLGGGLRLRSLRELTTTEGLGPVREVAFLAIEENVALANLAGFADLEEVRGDVNLTGQLALSSLAGLEDLQRIGGALQLARLPELTSVGGLAGLVNVGGRLLVNDLPQLTALGGLSALTSIAGDLTLLDLPALTSLVGLAPLSGVAGVEVQNAALSSLDGLPVPADATFLRLVGLASLTDAGALGPLRTVAGDLTLRGLPALEDLAPLAGVREVRGALTLDDVGMRSLASFAAWSGASRGLVVERCARLTDVSGVGAAGVRAADVRFEGNPALVEFTGLPEGFVPNNLRIADHGALTSLVGLELIAVFGELQLEGNAVLSSLAGLESLREVTNDLEIVDNDALASLGELARGSLTRVGRDLRVEDNALLAACEVDTLAADITVGRNVLNSGNAGPGCP